MRSAHCPVSITKCPDYRDVGPGLARVLAPLGGMSSFVHAGARVLLKANMVSAHDDAAAVTTSSALLAAVIDQVQRAGGRPVVGDSPALVSAAAVAARSRIGQVCQARGVPVITLDEPELVSIPRAARVKAFKLSSKLRDFDVILSLPKLKTHCFVGMTGAVKNLFGCIPGKLKTAHHLMQPDPILFSEMLLDLHDAVRPALTIVDAIVGMEGPGPGSGDPRRFGLLIAGPSAIAVDTVCARVLGFTDREVPTVSIAKRRGLPGASLEHIAVLGEPIGNVVIPDLRKPRSSATLLLPRFAASLAKRVLTARPSLLRHRCTSCGSCKAICAAGSITMRSRLPVFDDSKCIRCYCCHEVCPSRAIDLRRGVLSSLVEAG